VQASTDSHILFVFTYNFVANRAGGLNRARQILILLRESGLTATVYSRQSQGRGFWHNTAKCWSAADKTNFDRDFPGFELVLDTATLWAWLARKIKNALCTLLPTRADSILRFSIPGLDPQWRLLRRRGAAAVVIGYTHTMPELNGVFGDYRIIDQHDIEFILNQRVKRRPFFSLPVLAKIRREVGMLETADMILSLSFSERVVDQMILQRPTVVYLPNLSQVKPRPRTSVPPKYDLLFVGAYSHFNREGLSSFLQMVIDCRVSLRIAVVGTVCRAPEIQELASMAANIELLGFVGDLDAVYAASRATVCPIWGAGTKTKLLESLQHSLPVFASESSFEGLLPGYERCVFLLDLATIEDVLASNPNLEVECRRYIQQYIDAVTHNRFLDYVTSLSGTKTQAMIHDLGDDVKWA